MQKIKIISVALLLGCSFSFSAMAQNEKKKTDSIPLFTYSAAYEFLRSTHQNFFNGPAVKITRNLPGHFKPGIGIAYATTYQHHDNGLVLYNMKLLPVYANLTYDFLSKSKLEPFLEASAGITFIKYNQGTDEHPHETVPVKEQGLYLYTGFGLRYKVSKHFSPFIAAGFKGYHNSTNDLDINPHGITFQGGFRF